MNEYTSRNNEINRNELTKKLFFKKNVTSMIHIIFLKRIKKIKNKNNE